MIRLIQLYTRMYAASILLRCKVLLNPFVICIRSSLEKEDGALGGLGVGGVFERTLGVAREVLKLVFALFGGGSLGLGLALLVGVGCGRLLDLGIRLSLGLRGLTALVGGRHGCEEWIR